MIIAYVGITLVTNTDINEESKYVNHIKLHVHHGQVASGLHSMQVAYANHSYLIFVTHHKCHDFFSIDFTLKLERHLNNQYLM